MTTIGLTRPAAEPADTGVPAGDALEALDAFDPLHPDEPDPQPLGSDAGNRLREIVEHQPGCLTEVTAGGRVLAMNAAHVALMGANGVGQFYQDFVSLTDRERVDDFVRRVSQGESGSLEYLMVLPGARSRDVVSDAVPLERPSDHGTAVLMVTRDLTDLREFEDQLRHPSDSAPRRPSNSRSSSGSSQWSTSRQRRTESENSWLSARWSAGGSDRH
ncbi:MAG: PAS domain-containing protein [bacterium]